MRAANRQLAKLDSLQEENVLLSSELSKLNDDLNRERREYAETLENMRVSNLEKETAMKEDMKQKVKNIRLNAMDNAKKRLTQLSHELINDNAALKKTLDETQAKLSEVTLENKQLREELARTRADSSLKTEEESLYAESKMRDSLQVCSSFLLVSPFFLHPAETT